MIAGNPTWVAVLVIEAGLLGGLAWVGLWLARRRVNGPCRVCLGLLLAWRISVIATLPCRPPCWEYLWGALFAYAFLYATHHIACLVRRLGPGDAGGAAREAH